MATIVLSAFDVANFPGGGGHFWVYMQYAQGLRRLGGDVYWLEEFRRGKAGRGGGHGESPPHVRRSHGRTGPRSALPSLPSPAWPSRPHSPYSPSPPPAQRAR